MANELSQRGWKALILEKGGGETVKGTAAQLISMALIPGRSLHFTEQMVGMNGYEKDRQILRNTGARHIYKSWCLAVHPGGTAARWLTG